MPTIHKRPNFFETFEGAEIEAMLQDMEADQGYNTQSSYTADSVKYPDNILSFMEKHKCYIIANPSLDPRSYVANLRMKTKLR
jgi:hypothetical protein